MSEFIQYLINPKSTEKNGSLVFNFIYSVIILVALIISQILLQIIFLAFWNYDSLEGQDYVKSINEGYSVFISCFIAPLIEEVTFRLPLMKFDVINFRISFSLFIGLLLSFITSLVSDVTINPFVIQFSFGLVAFILTYKLKFEKFRTYWDNNSNIIFWGILLLFCLSHIPQFLMYNLDLGLIMKSTVSILLSGIFLAFARIRYGIIYSIFIHCIYNYIILVMNT